MTFPKIQNINIKEKPYAIIGISERGVYEKRFNTHCSI